jgi:hypothetical protein
MPCRWLLAVLGLDLDPPSQAARFRKRGLWTAAKNAGVSHVQEVPPDTLGHALVGGSVPKGYAAHLTRLLDEAPVPLVVMAVEGSCRERRRGAQGCMAQRREAGEVTGRAPARPLGVMTPMPAAPTSSVLTTAIRSVRIRVAVVHTPSAKKGAPCAMLRSICEPSPSSET